MTVPSAYAIANDPAASIGRMKALDASSLRVRLPLLISALIAVVLSLFLWVAFQQVDRALAQAGGARAQGAADQLANLMAQQTQQRIEVMQRVAQSSAVREYVLHPSEATAEPARQRLVTLAARGQPPVELWDQHGRQVLTVAGPPPDQGSAAPVPVPESVAPTASGIAPFQTARDAVFWAAVADVRDDPAAGPASPHLGYVSSRRVMTSASASDVIGRLVGIGAVVKMGNQAGGVWTDFSKPVAAPPVDAARSGPTEFHAAAGGDRLGANAPIRGTPWAVWVEFPRDLIVAPARIFLARMLTFAFVFVVAAAVAARALSARITTPLRDLTDAAEAIAAGHDVPPVRARRRDEVGRLGAAFNTMAAQVRGTQRDLEERVQQRTASLAEAGAALEQRIAEVNATRQELDRFFALSLDMLCIAGTDGYFKRLNPAWSATLGWSDAELRGKPYLDFVHPDDRAETMRQAAGLADGTAVVSFENRYACRDGSYRWLQWKSIPVPGEGVVYASARDVTDQQASVAKLQALTAELEAFSYSVSHDLRAPLRHVMGFASLLEESAAPALDDQGRRYVRTIAEAAARMGRLIDDLLVFSRMGRAEFLRGRVDLGALVEEARREVAAAHKERRIEWRIHPLPSVSGDAAMLRLVLTNLISNAVKYTGTRSVAEIEIGANATPEETVLFVRDNGVGFDMQYAHKLFGVFQRLHRTEEFEGTGIGLANVRRIVHRHGGRVWAESTVNGGATFYVSLPSTGAAA